MSEIKTKFKVGQEVARIFHSIKNYSSVGVIKRILQIDGVILYECQYGTFKEEDLAEVKVISDKV